MSCLRVSGASVNHAARQRTCAADDISSQRYVRGPKEALRWEEKSFAHLKDHRAVGAAEPVWQSGYMLIMGVLQAL